MARPKTAPSAHRKQIAITLPPELISKAKAYAEMGGGSVSGMVEATLTDFLAKMDRELERKFSPRTHERTH